MSTEEQARELMAQQRQHQEHLQESMRNRTESEVHESNHGDATTQEEARELMAQQRQHEEHVQESMRNRAESEQSTAHS